MDCPLNLTYAERERYNGFYLNSYFAIGFEDYNLGALYGHWVDRGPLNQDSYEAQCYDRGSECAMLRYANQRVLRMVEASNG